MRQRGQMGVFLRGQKADALVGVLATGDARAGGGEEVLDADFCDGDKAVGQWLVVGGVNVFAMVLGADGAHVGIARAGDALEGGLLLVDQADIAEEDAPVAGRGELDESLGEKVLRGRDLAAIARCWNPADGARGIIFLDDEVSSADGVEAVQEDGVRLERAAHAAVRGPIVPTRGSHASCAGCAGWKMSSSRWSERHTHLL